MGIYTIAILRALNERLQKTCLDLTTPHCPYPFSPCIVGSKGKGNAGPEGAEEQVRILDVLLAFSDGPSRLESERTRLLNCLRDVGPAIWLKRSADPCFDRSTPIATR